MARLDHCSSIGSKLLFLTCGSLPRLIEPRDTLSARDGIAVPNPWHPTFPKRDAYGASCKYCWLNVFKDPRLKAVSGIWRNV